MRFASFSITRRKGFEDADHLERTERIRTPQIDERTVCAVMLEALDGLLDNALANKSDWNRTVAVIKPQSARCLAHHVP